MADAGTPARKIGDKLYVSPDATHIKDTNVKKWQSPQTPVVVQKNLFRKIKGVQVAHTEVSPARSKTSAIIRDSKLSEQNSNNMKIVLENPVYQECTDLYEMKDNDIFETPSVCYDYMSAMLGVDVRQFFDPSPIGLPHGRDWDGRKGNWKSPAFCNPPFSGTFEWIEKMVQEAEKGVEVIALFNQPSYFVVEGKVRVAKWANWKKRASFEMMSWTNDFQGCGHKWFRWGENKLTGEKTGGPMWGVVIMRITANVKPVGESLLPVTPAAHQVVTDWRASKKGAADEEVSTNEGLALLPMSFSVGHTIFLECFAGTGSVGKIAETIPGSKVVSIDIHAETMGYKPTIVADILKVDFNNLGFDPDFLWMSPPCQTFSRMGAGKHRTKSNMEPKTKAGRLGDQILSHTVDAINILARKNPNMKWYMENPVGLMQYSEIVDLLPPHTLATVSYCQYGFDYQKNTHIWTNDIEWAKKAK